jgi:hypothetical protein
LRGGGRGPRARSLGFRLGFDGIEEVANVDEHVEPQVDDIVDRPEKIIVHLLLAEVHAGPGIEAAESGEAQAGVGDVDEFHR